MLREAGKILIAGEAPVSVTARRRGDAPSQRADALINAALCASPHGRKLAFISLPLGGSDICERRCFVHAAKFRPNDTVAVFIPFYLANNVPEMFT